MDRQGEATTGDWTLRELRPPGFARASALDQTPAWVGASPGPPVWCRAGCARRWRHGVSRSRPAQRCARSIVGRGRLVVLDLTDADAVLKRLVGQCNESLAWSRESIGSVAAIIRTHWRRPRTIRIAVIAGAAPPIISARSRLRFRSDDSAGRGANCCASDRAGSTA
jgi:hypothetical protein